jgi:hypothetical protein
MPNMRLGLLGIAAAFTSAFGVSVVGGPASLAAQGSAAAQRHVYHVTAVRAVPGQTAALLKLLSVPSDPPDADYAVVFRHSDGHEWDFLLVEHVGPTATVQPGPAPAATNSAFSQAAAWHQDTFAVGPSLDEFRRALSLPAGGGTAPGVYLLGEYTAAPGHGVQMRQVLQQIAADRPSKSVLMQHIEGAGWGDLTIQHYANWREFADEQDRAAAAAAKTSAPDRGLQLREHMSVHHDTFATVASVIVPARR